MPVLFGVGETLGYGIHYMRFSLTDNGKLGAVGVGREKGIQSLDLFQAWEYNVALIFETLMGVFRIRLQCGKSGRAPRIMLGLANNALNHYMANPM